MSIHFHSLRIKEVRQETPDCVSLLFEIPEHLKNDFKFKQGQSLTMRTTISDEEVRRTYSICSSPMENEIRVAIKKADKGLFSTFANEILKPGDQLEVMEPVGKFYTALHPEQKKNYLAFAAGSGITPVLSIIKTSLATEPASSFTLVYASRNRNSIVFFEELEGLKNRYLHRFNLINLLSREIADTPIYSGRIDKDKLTSLSKLIRYENMDEIFICGPQEMIFTTKDFLQQRGIDKRKIHFELFTTPGSTSAENENKKAITNGAVGLNPDQLKSKITVKLDGRSFNFELGYNDEPILDAALKQGADLPYACKGGVCCTCKARLITGEVEMEVHWGLEDDEIREGYILTCQSHPKTEKVVVDFDIK
ncbi:MAG: 1,2-phenylacetyl-CoA epoxidase subunit PaaE [Chitinophagaceae bacterium]